MSDAFENAWGLLAQAGLPERPWVERPRLESVVLAVGTPAIRVERALRETDAVQQRLRQALAEWAHQDRRDAAMVRRLHRSVAPRWWHRTPTWGVWERETAQARLARVQARQIQLQAMVDALASVQRGVEGAVQQAEQTAQMRPEGERPAWQAVLQQLRLSLVGLAHQRHVLLPWVARQAEEARQWALWQTAQAQR